MTPDRLRLWAPLVVAAACIAVGLVRDELSLIGVGAGVLGLPGFIKATPSSTPLPPPQGEPQ